MEFQKQIRIIYGIPKEYVQPLAPTNAQITHRMLPNNIPKRSENNTFRQPGTTLEPDQGPGTLISPNLSPKGILKLPFGEPMPTQRAKQTNK